MIRVVGPNPAMDRVSTWPPIVLGAVNRAKEVMVMPGGKGLNVARAVRALDLDVAAYGFLGGHVGAAIRERINDDGVVDRHAPIDAETRVCFITVEPGAHRSTVLNEPGPFVSAAEREAFLGTLRGDVGAEDILVLSGSLPDSLESTFAGEIVAIGQTAGARTVVDSSGAALRAAAAQRPWMIKCNRDELAALTDVDQAAGLPPSSDASIIAVAVAARRVREQTADLVVVTLGPDGVVLADGRGVIHAQVPRVEVVNSVGCGDVLLAGLLTALERGDGVRDALVLGAACGSAAATHLPPELPRDFDAGAWTTMVSLRPLAIPR